MAPSADLMSYAGCLVPCSSVACRRSDVVRKTAKTELEKAFAACPLVYFTYGLCEPHGPQCTLGLDSLKAHAIACRAAREHGGIVAPVDYWHIHEIGLYGSWAADRIGEVERTWLTAV